MTEETIPWGWIILTAICFAVGFGVSWIRMRKRIMQRYQQAVEQELKKRVAEEVLRRVAQGPETPHKHQAADTRNQTSRHHQ